MSSHFVIEMWIGNLLFEYNRFDFLYFCRWDKVTKARKSRKIFAPYFFQRQYFEKLARFFVTKPIRKSGTFL